MPINTNIRLPVGGGEIGTGIAQGVQLAGESIYQSLEREKDRALKREQMFYSAVTDIDPMTAILDRNKNIYQQLSEEHQNFLAEMTKRKKGRFTSSDILEAVTIKNRINNKISQIKKEEESIAKQMAEFQKDQSNKAVYDPAEFNNGLNAYINEGEVRSLLVPKALDPVVWADNIKSAQKPTRLDKETGGQIVSTFQFSTPEERAVYYMNEVNRNPRFVSGLNKTFLGEWEHPLAPKEEDRQKYLEMAGQLQQDGRSISGNPQTDAAILWGGDNVANRIMPDVTEKRPKKGTGKDKTVEQRDWFWKFGTTPVTYKGPIEFYEQGKNELKKESLRTSSMTTLTDGENIGREKGKLYWIAITPDDETTYQKFVELGQKYGDDIPIEEWDKTMMSGKIKTIHIPFQQMSDEMLRGRTFKDLDVYLQQFNDQQMITPKAQSKAGPQTLIEKLSRPFMKQKNEDRKQDFRSKYNY